MGTRVSTSEDMPEPIIRRKTVSVSNDGSMMAVHDYGEYGTLSPTNQLRMVGPERALRRCRQCSERCAAVSP